jgi:hypothetical protein
MPNMRQYAQTVRDGVWSAPYTKVGARPVDWQVVRNLNHLKKDSERGYVMGVQHIRNFVSKHMEGWTMKMSSVKVDGGIRYYLVCRKG